MSQAMHLDTYSRLRNYIVQQVSMRRESLIETNFMKPAVSGSHNASQKPVAMEMYTGKSAGPSGWDQQDQDYQGDLDGNQYMDDQELNYAGKGGAKGRYFEGVCNHCGQYGHRLQDCHKKTAEIQAWRQGKGAAKGADFGKGKGNDGKGGDAKGNGKGREKGGWKGQSKGVQWRPGGPYSWGKGAGKYGKGLHEVQQEWSVLDASMSEMGIPEAWAGEDYSQPSRMFSLMHAPMPEATAIPTHNRFDGLKVADQEYPDLPINEVKMPMTKMPRWNKTMRKQKQSRLAGTPHDWMGLPDPIMVTLQEARAELPKSEIDPQELYYRNQV